MRAATFFILSAVCIIGISALPTSGHARSSAIFSFGAPRLSRHQEDRRRANHRFVRHREHRAAALALVPFYSFDDADAPLPLAPEAPADTGRSHALPAKQLPACRETLDGVTIFRGKPCRA
jgi:hypothetical protein